MTTDNNPTVREIWEAVRPADEAFRIVAKLGLDATELEDLEARWQAEILPHLNSLPFAPLVRRELERSVRFCEDRIKAALAEYERNGRPFSDRRHLIENRIPVAERFLEAYRGWLTREPSIRWEPSDVVEVKRRGMEKFIRSNLDRFYE